MTRIEKQIGNIYLFEASGHARNIGEREGNILCAAISMLTQTLAHIASKEGATVEIKDGYIKIQGKKTKAILEADNVISEGLKLLKEDYPDEINLVGEF